VKTLAVAVAGLAVALTACGGARNTAARSTTAKGPIHRQLSPPRYLACGEITLAKPKVHLPTYAHDVSCTVARAVAKRCYARSCSGEFALPYSGIGDLSFPEPPMYKPFGFECYQGVPSITVGLPAPTTPTGSEWRPFVCHRERTDLSQQLTGYLVLVGSGP